MKIEIESILDVAMTLLDEKGLAGFNMRALAGRLGVQASALYWHVGDKGELLSLMAAKLYDTAFCAAPAGSDWRRWLIEFGRAFRHELLSHRDSAQLCATAKLEVKGAQGAAERLAQPLVDAGVDRQLALRYTASVIALTLGWVVYEQSNGLRDFLASLIGFDQSYILGLESMVKGFPQPSNESGQGASFLHPSGQHRRSYKDCE